MAIKFLFTICYLTFGRSPYLTSNERIRTSWAINHYPQIYKSGTFLKAKQIMPYVERATSPRNRGCSKHLNTKQMEEPFRGIYIGGKNAEEYKVRGA